MIKLLVTIATITLRKSALMILLHNVITVNTESRIVNLSLVDILLIDPHNETRSTGQSGELASF